MKRTQTQSVLSLRERKKRAVRGELSLAALRLAKQHGLSNVRTEDIVAAAGVSRRTFNNYFANKYEAIVDRHVERVQQTVKALRARSHDEKLWPALTAAVLAPYGDWARAFSDVPAAQRKKTLRVFEEPLLRAELWKANFAVQQPLAQAIAERTGSQPSDLHPTLVAATILAAITIAMDRCLRAKRPQPLVALIREALEQLEQGLPEPRKTRKQ